MIKDNETFIFSEDKELKIKTTKAFTSKILKDLAKICEINQNKVNDSIEYSISKISNYNKFLYMIAAEINKIIVNDYFKKALKENFDNYKEIFKLHQTEAYENAYMEFFIKAKLMLFFKYNDCLNIPTFLVFNCKKVYEEFDLIVEAEVEASGCLYTNEGIDLDDEESIDLNKESQLLNNRYNGLFQYISGKKLKNEVKDMFVFQDGKTIKIEDEQGNLLNTSITGIDFKDAKNFYIKNCNDTKDDVEILGFYLIILTIIGAPERVIIFNSLPEKFTHDFLRDFSIVKKILGINTECYISKDNKPM